jgi:excinuclease ABC subunit C
VTDRSPQEVFGSFLSQFYAESPLSPDEVLLPVETEDAAALSEYLSERRGRKVEILCPKRGLRARLVELARTNAENAYRVRHGKSEANRQVLNALQADLKLRELPSHIECFDISNIGGQLAVGSMVTFKECVPDKSLYRHFKIQTVSQSDDFAMMYEVLKRRYAGGAEEGNLPDLAIIDGGKGQLSVARRVFEELGITEVEVIGLAKSRRRAKPGGRKVVTDERVFKPEFDEPVVLPQESPHLLYLTRIRDEAHRFAINYHRKLRQKEYQRRGLSAIPGVGDVLRRRLLERFGSSAAVRGASVEEIAAVEGISDRLATAIYRHFHPEQADSASRRQKRAEADG